jgi:hypothetical protein
MRSEEIYSEWLESILEFKCPTYSKIYQFHFPSCTKSLLQMFSIQICVYALPTNQLQDITNTILYHITLGPRTQPIYSNKFRLYSMSQKNT